MKLGARVFRAVVNRTTSLWHGIQNGYAVCFMKSPEILTIEETIERIVSEHCSVSRNGDGELDIMMGHDIPFQKYDSRLAAKMVMALQATSPKYISCLPDIFHDLNHFNQSARTYYVRHLYHKRFYWYRLAKAPVVYGNAYISRFYMDWRDKSKASTRVALLKKIWDKRHIYIIEGEKSRLGIGNDLFDNALSIRRILAPARNAFCCYDEVLNYVVREVPKECLILLALGPVATAMAYELHMAGFWAVDIGHVDIEYEWMRMGATTKVAIAQKYTNEAIDGCNVGNMLDDKYQREIIKRFYEN